MSCPPAACHAVVIRRPSTRRGGTNRAEHHPCLWFDGNAEEAARFYTSIFPNSRIDKVSTRRPTTRAARPASHDRRLHPRRHRFLGLNGGPDFKFNEAISFVIDCKDQAEVDRYWDALIEGGGEHERLRLAEGPLRRLVAGRAATAQRDDRQPAIARAPSGRWRRCSR